MVSSKIGKTAIIGFVLLIVPFHAHAYSNYDNWCDLDGQHYYINTSSFTSRGMPSDVAHQIKSMAVWWSEAGADFDFTYWGTTSGCRSHRTVCAQTEAEDDGLQGGTHAYTSLSRSWYPWCDFWGKNLHQYWIVVNADLTWAYDAEEAEYHLNFPTMFAHESGHALGGAHTNPTTYPDAIMYQSGPVGNNERRFLHSDDQLGLIANSYGRRTKTMKIRSASYNGNGTLSFGNIYTFGGSYYNTHLRPAIIGNWHNTYLLEADDFDYVVAWVTNTGSIRVACVQDTSFNSHSIVRLATIPGSNTTSPPSVAIGTHDKIKIAWRGVGTSNPIKITHTNFNLSSFTTQTISSWQPMSTPVITYMPAENRYVLAWIRDDGSERYRIAIAVSIYATAWYAYMTYPGNDPQLPEFVTSLWHPPAITCYGNLTSSDTCQMNYTRFRTSDVLYVDQQGFQLGTYGTYLDTVSTDYWIYWNSTYAPLSIAAGGNEWLYTMVESNADVGIMWYRAKPFWKGVGGDYRYYSTYNRSDMTSRVGFPIGYNYRQGWYNIVWYDHKP